MQRNIVPSKVQAYPVTNANDGSPRGVVLQRSHVGRYSEFLFEGDFRDCSGLLRDVVDYTGGTQA